MSSADHQVFDWGQLDFYFDIGDCHSQYNTNMVAEPVFEIGEEDVVEIAMFQSREKGDETTTDGGKGGTNVGNEFVSVPTPDRPNPGAASGTQAEVPMFPMSPDATKGSWGAAGKGSHEPSGKTPRKICRSKKGRKCQRMK